jgi:acyl carrier protein
MDWLKVKQMVTKEDLQQQLFDLLKRFVPPGYQLSSETDLLADLNLDSMKVMDIVAEVEDTFDISVPINIIPYIRTIGDFASQLQNMLEEES